MCKSTYDRLAEFKGVQSPFDPYLKTDDERMCFSYLWHKPLRFVPFNQGMIALSHEALGEAPFQYFPTKWDVYKLAQKVGQFFFNKECNYSVTYWNKEMPKDANLIIVPFLQYIGSRPLKLECEARLKNQYSKERDGMEFQEAAAQWLMPEADRLRNLYFLLEQHLMENTNEEI